MARTAQELEFGGFVYSVIPLGASQSVDVFEKLIKVVAPGSRGVADAVSVARTLDALALMSVPTAIAAVLDDLKVGTTLEFAKVFGKLTNVRSSERTDGPGPRLEGQTFDDHFAGRLSHLYRWLAFCIEVNYGDFFADAGPVKDLIAKLRALFPAQQSPSQSPPE